MTDNTYDQEFLKEETDKDIEFLFRRATQHIQAKNYTGTVRAHVYMTLAMRLMEEAQRELMQMFASLAIRKSG